MNGIHDPIPLELDPNTVHAGARKCQIELYLRRAVGDEGMRMHHIDQVVAGSQHMAPGAKIFLQTVCRRNGKTHLRILAGGGLGRECREFHLDVLSTFR